MVRAARAVVGLISVGVCVSVCVTGLPWICKSLHAPRLMYVFVLVLCGGINGAFGTWLAGHTCSSASS